jgi:uncharacterized protein YndB with AHSA1/START domain
MTDVTNRAAATHREIGRRQTADGDARYLLIRRHYDATVADVWDACTNPDRISRWLMPISGDLRLGGTYQLEGNAGGTILRCEPPRFLAATWVFGEPKPGESSVVEVRLSPDANGGTILQLDHTAVFDLPDDFWLANIGDFGAGWETVTTALANHLDRPGDSQPAEHDGSTASAWSEIATAGLDRTAP